MPCDDYRYSMIPFKLGIKMSLTTKDASVILGMVARGDKKHDIASWFGENPARVQEVIAGDYGNLSAAAPDQLFPKGAPGLKGRRLKSAVDKAVTALKTEDAKSALAILEDALANYSKNES